MNIVNTILWLNTPEQISSQGSTIEVTYSNVEGGFEGTGNINSDPLFVDPTAGDFFLQSVSPCIDRADEDAAPELDMEGNPRVDAPNTANTGVGNPDYVDIGPYEYQIP